MQNIANSQYSILNRTSFKFAGLFLLLLTSSCLSKHEIDTKYGQIFEEGTETTPDSINFGTLSIDDRVYVLDGTNEPLLQQNTYALDFSVQGADADVTYTYTCAVETIDLHVNDDRTLASATDCTSLPSLSTTNSILVSGNASFDTATGILTWTPTTNQFGTYKFTITATTTGHVHSETVYITVREAFSTTGLIALFDARMAEVGTGQSAVTSPGSTGTTWPDLSINGNDADISNITGWGGTGENNSTTLSPYGLTLDSANSDYLDFGNVLSGTTDVMFSMWIKPNSPDADSVILHNGGETGDGFILKMSDANNPGRLVLQVGKQSYSDLILTHSPKAYYRFNETAGSVVTDSSTSGIDGTYLNSPTLNQPAASSMLDGSSVSFNGTTHNATVGTTSDFSYIHQHQPFGLSLWVKLNDPNADDVNMILSNHLGTSTRGFGLQFDNRTIASTNKQLWFLTTRAVVGTYGVSVQSNINAITDTDWHHIAVTSDGLNYYFYVDGEPLGSTVLETNPPAIGNSATSLSIGGEQIGGADYGLDGNVDEVAIFDYHLSAYQVKSHYLAGKFAKFPDNYILKLGPMAYYPMNDKTLGTAKDLTGNYSGTYTSGVRLNHEGPYSDLAATGAQFGLGITAINNINNNSDFSYIHNTGRYTMLTWLKHSLYPSPVIGHAFNTMQALTTEKGFYLRWHTNGFWMCGYGLGGTGVYSHTGVGVQNANWNLVACTGNGTSGSIYTNGVLRDTVALPGTVSGASSITPEIGAYNNGTAIRFFGSLAHTALFRRALSATEINNIYNGIDYAKCLSDSKISNDQWYHVAGIYNSGTGKVSLYINGKRECEVTPGTTFTSTDNLIFGANTSLSNHWKGEVAHLSLHSSGDANAVFNQFASLANRFRKYPIESIVEDNLVLHLDGANANGNSPGGQDLCNASTWKDITQNHFIGRLGNFPTTCTATEGWTSTAPYGLKFNRTNEHVCFGDVLDSTFSGADKQFSLELWIKPGSTVEYEELIAKHGDGSVSTDLRSWIFRLDNVGRPEFLWYGDNANATNLRGVRGSTGVTDDTKWYHIVLTYDGSIDTNNGLDRVKIYVDGQLDTTALSLNSGTLADSQDIPSTTAPLCLGARADANAYMTYTLQDGTISVARVYSDVLSSAEVQQNCLAQEARFGGTICPAP